MMRSASAGGRVLLLDLDGQMLWHFPPDQELEEELNRVIAALAEYGFDPFVGRKLLSLAKGVGLHAIDVQAEAYHLFAGAIDARNGRLWETKLDILVPAVAAVLRSEAAARSLKERFLAYLRRQDTLTYSIMFTVVGTKTDSPAGSATEALQKAPRDSGGK